MLLATGAEIFEERNFGHLVKLTSRKRKEQWAVPSIVAPQRAGRDHRNEIAPAQSRARE